MHCSRTYKHIVFGPAKRYHPPGKRDACRVCRSFAVRCAGTQASQVRTFPFAPTAVFSLNAPRLDSACAACLPRRKCHVGRWRRAAQPARTTSPCSSPPCTPTVSRFPNWTSRSQYRSVYKGAINPRFPSTSSDLSRTLGRQVSPCVRWQCRTSGQRGLIPPSISPSRICTRLRDNSSLALFLRNTGLRGRGDVDYRGQLMAREVSPRSPLARDLSR